MHLLVNQVGKISPVTPPTHLFKTGVSESAVTKETDNLFLSFDTYKVD